MQGWDLIIVFWVGGDWGVVWGCVSGDGGWGRFTVSSIEYWGELETFNWDRSCHSICNFHNRLHATYKFF